MAKAKKTSLLTEVIKYLDTLLDTKGFQDASRNGLQVDSGKENVLHVAVSVDSGLSVLEKAVALSADLLIVHHGLYWNDIEPINGIFGKKIRTLIQGGTSLYASHLPLDGHLKVGNNALLAEHYGLKNCKPFAEHHGKTIGVLAESKTPQSLAHFVKLSQALIGANLPLSLPFGVSQIKKVAIVSGSASRLLPEAKAAGADLFISGEPRHEVYHIAQELGINALFAGHYATETLGVRALANKLEKEFGVRTTFIDEPSGI